MTSVMSLFKMMILVQLFFSFAITSVVYMIPDSELEYVNSFSSATTDVDNNQISSQIQDNLDRQTNLPLIDVGAMVFYSTNIIVDLLLNFFFAVPEMIFLVVGGIGHFVNIDVLLSRQLQAFTMAVILMLYFLGLIQLLTGLRAGRVID